MDTEEKSAKKIAWTAEKIWGNFLQCGNGNTWIDIDEDIKSPSPEEQRRNIYKFQFRGGLKIIKEEGNHFELLVIKEKFQELREQFSNPKMAFDSYRPRGISPIVLPEKTSWEHIIMKFLNGNDVKITLRNNKNFNRVVSFSEMGFRNKKNQRPNQQWNLLMLLAQRGGAIFWETKSNLRVKEINNLKTQKKLLSKILKNIFQIEDDPFFPYTTEGGYKIKITLIPERVEEPKLDKSNRDLEINSYFEEQTPLVG